MTPDQFFAKFALFADTPNAVAKMRELILDLAVRGRLSERIDSIWEERVLGDVIELVSGQHLLADEHNTQGRGIPYLTGPADFGPAHPVPTRWTETPKVVAEPGDILITVKGAGIGKTNVLGGQKTAISRQLMAIRVHGADPEFIHLTIRRAAEVFQESKTGIAIPGIGRKDVLDLKITLPPLAEQKRIVAKVDELMALCDQLESQQKQRETKKATIVQAALTRFTDAPTPANLELLFHKSYAIDPAELRKTILTLAVQGSLTESSSNNVEWPLVTMKDVSLQITDGEHATPQRISSGVPLATAKNVRDGFLDLTTTDYVAQSTAEKCWKRCKPRDQDILMVCVGATTGRVCLAHNPPDIVLVRSVALIRPNRERIVPSYLDLFLRSPAGQSQIWENVKQSAQPCLYLGKMAEFEISLPPLAEQKRIVAKVEELMALVDKLEAQLAASRDAGEKLMEAVVAAIAAAA